jgi:trimeric autotransporter adhesin
MKTLLLLLLTATTALAQCDVPTGLSSENIYQNSAGVRWSFPGGSTFTLRWRAVGATAWNTVPGIPAATYRLTVLASGTTYEWQVEQVCSGGTVQSGYSAVQTFTTQPCLPPNNTLAINALSPIRVALNWEGGGPRYELQWKPTAAATWNSRSGPANTSRVLTTVLPGTPYQWRVRTLCPVESGGPPDVSIWRDGPNFTPPTCPVPNNLGADPGLIQTGSLTYPVLEFIANLSWSNAISGEATPYELQYRRADDPAAFEPTFTGPWTTPSLDGTTALRLRNLEAGTAYQWQVRTLCTPAALSAYVPASFTATPCFSLINLQTHTILPTSAVLTATKNIGGDYLTALNEFKAYFFFRWRAVGAATWNTARTDPHTGPTLSLTGLTPNTDYEWQVRAECASTERMPATALQPFRTPTAICNVPGGGSIGDVTSRTARLNWLPGLGNSSTNIRFRPVGSTTWTDVPGLTGNSHELTNLTANTTYEAQIQATCASGALSGTVALGTFTPTCAATQFAPLTASLDVSATGAQVRWAHVEAGTTYDLRWQTVGSPTWINVPGPLTYPANPATALYGLAGLGPGLSYAVQVRTNCPGGGQSAYVTGPTLSTPACTAPASAFALAVGGTSAQISAGLPSGAAWELQWRPAGSTTWTNVPGLTATPHTLTGLSPGTTYQFQARGVCGGTPTAYTPVVQLTTL